jgi:hypothetical protein
VDIKVTDFGISKIINIIATCSLQTIAGIMWCDGWHLSCLNQSRISAHESTHSSQIYIAMPLHTLKSSWGGCLTKSVVFQKREGQGRLETNPACFPAQLSVVPDQLLLGWWCPQQAIFSRLCTELRHLEGILMMSSKYSHEAMESPDTRFMGQQLGKG